MLKLNHLPTISSLLVHPQEPLIHRDLSWLQFNERVLAEARSRSNPLLKRLKFLSISASNLDEFFMIRLASLQRSIATSKDEEIKQSLQRIENVVLKSLERFGQRQARTFLTLRDEFARSNVFLHRKDTKDSPGFQLGRKIFQEKILPGLQTKNNFQFSDLQELRNLQMMAFVQREIWFEVPKTVPAVFSHMEDDSEEVHIFFLDDLLLAHLDHMLPVKEKPGILRITRDSDFTLDLGAEDTESIPDLVRSSLGNREKGRIVRLQFAGNFPQDFLQECAASLKLDPRQIFTAPKTLCLQGLFSAVNVLPDRFRQGKKFDNPPLEAMIPPSFRGPELLFEDLKYQDFLLHHPYDSYDSFLTWLQAACEDPNVTMIEQTIYRTDASPAIIDALKKAAKEKKIRVILELRARFDEANNLKLAEELSKAGVQVAFGFGALKLHAKLALVTRKENGKEFRYTHLSTGNYHARTARQYTDLAIFTSNEQIGADARYFFDSVLSAKIPDAFQVLVTAPTKLHQKIRSLIKAETHAAQAGGKGRIIAKVNALVDEKIIEDLYHASQAGVRIDLIVRGACSLIPGVKGLSDNIRVVSIVDRFLEHSRIYYFENSRAMYLSSADWMPRNFFSRLEIAYPVLDERLYRYISQILLPAYINDTVKARRLTSRGVWVKCGRPKNAPPMHAQAFFASLAKEEYRNTPLNETTNPDPTRPSRQE